MNQIKESKYNLPVFVLDYHPYHTFWPDYQASKMGDKTKTQQPCVLDLKTNQKHNNLVFLI